MAITLVLVLAYLIATAILGIVAARRPVGSASSRRDYVLGGSRSGTFLLLATMAATNFSAFTVFGLSGAGYRLGWAYYPAMGLGTGLMGLSFILLGIPLRRLSAARGYLTPADFIRDRYGSPLLAKIFSLALLALTLPYLATQAVAGGRMLALVTGWPYAVCAGIIVGVTALYTFRGGFRAVAATDALQLGVLIVGAGIAFFAVLSYSGGFSAAGARLAELSPAHLSREGAGAGLSFLGLLGTWALWVLADPLFPQLFQRFYAARDDRSLARTAAFYPLVTGGLFFLTVGVGVLGAALLPGLKGKETEQVFTLLAAQAGSPFLGAVFALAALAALMSTMDSQLLALSSIASHEFLPKRWTGVQTDRALVALLSLGAWLIALSPPTLILDALTGLAFPGYAALAPAVIAGIYAPRLGTRGAAFITLLGLGLVGLEATGLLAPGSIPPALFNAGAQGLALGLVLAAAKRRGLAIPETANLARNAAQGTFRPAWLALCLGVGFLGADFWNYGKPSVMLAGLPAWVWWSGAMCLLLSLAMAGWREDGRGQSLAPAGQSALE